MLMRVIAPFGICAGVLVSITVAAAQDWRNYGNDPGGSRYSALTQINKSNVSSLKVAWTYRTGDVSDGSEYPSRSAFECTPLMIDGVLFLSTPFSRVIALDPETGKELWAFDPKLSRDKRYNLFINRGVSYWASGNDKRIFLGTLDGRLFSLNAQTGKPVPGFGNEGWIDLRKGVADEFPNAGYGMTSPVAIYKDLVIAGSLVPDGEPQGPSGDVRAFDARTGKQAVSHGAQARRIRQ
jgi:quinoprotein glucose dehydrogenase